VKGWDGTMKGLAIGTALRKRGMSVLSRVIVSRAMRWHFTKRDARLRGLRNTASVYRTSRRQRHGSKTTMIVVSDILYSGWVGARTKTLPVQC
jgi:hypothetical protein